MQYDAFLTTILQYAGKIASRYFGNVKGTTKAGDNNQVVTKADLEIGNYINAQIQKEYPAYNIIDEEAGVIDRKSDYTWVIDPIDGTSNFAQGVPLYGVMIGLLNKDKPIVGGVILPSFNEIVLAEKNKGSYSNGKKIQVANEKKLLSTLTAYNIDGHRENPSLTYEEGRIFSEIVLNIRSVRSSGPLFDYIMLAKGRYGGCLNRTSKIWDNVPLQVIIQEAGGVYSDFFGQPMDYSNPLTKAKDNFTVCAGAPILHKQLQKIIHGSI